MHTGMTSHLHRHNNLAVYCALAAVWMSRPLLCSTKCLKLSSLVCSSFPSRLQPHAHMAASTPLNTLRPTMSTAASTVSTSRSLQVPVTQVSGSTPPGVTVSLSTANTQTGAATAQLASTPGSSRSLFDKCRRSKLIQRIHHLDPKAWNSIVTLIVATVGLIAAIYYAAVQYKSAQVSNTIAKEALLYTVWTAKNDFRATCTGDLEAGRLLSAACHEALGSPAQPPPNLSKRGLSQGSEDIWTQHLAYHLALGFVISNLLPLVVDSEVIAIFAHSPIPYGLAICLLMIADAVLLLDPSLIWLTCASCALLLHFGLSASSRKKRSVRARYYFGAMTIFRYLNLLLNALGGSANLFAWLRGSFSSARVPLSICLVVFIFRLNARIVQRQFPFMTEDRFLCALSLNMGVTLAPWMRGNLRGIA